jgi:oligopeptide transport system substrate-binding protein
MMATKKVRLLVLALGLLQAGLTGCGEERAAAASGPRVLRLLITEEPPQLDSTRATDQVSIFLLGHLMEGLTRYGKNGELIPGVAESWRLGDRSATFRLRKDARWADGRPVTSRDFVFAWRTAVDPKTASEYAFILYPVKNAERINRGELPPSALGVSAPDDWTLEVRLEKPCGYFLGLTAFPTYLPVREDFHRSRGERYAADARELLSNGPFILTRWIHGAALTLEKNPRYWDAGRVRIDRIEIPYVTQDVNARFNLFTDGKVDTLGLSKEQLDRAQAERLRMKSFASGSLFFLEFNHRPGRPTVSRHLRRAIKLVVDPAEYASRVVGIPGTRPGVSLIPYWVPGVKDRFRKEYPLRAVRPDLSEAERELELARRELGGVIPPLVWLTGDSPTSAREAEYFQRVFRDRLGIELRIDKQIFKQRLAKMTAGDFDIVSAGWGPDFADPMTFAELFASWNENNRGKYKSERYDALIRRAQSTADPRARMDAMAEAEAIALADVALLPLFEQVILYAHQPRVEGIVRHVVGPDPDFTFARIAE